MKREIILSLCLLIMVIPVVKANAVVMFPTVYADSLLFDLSATWTFRHVIPVFVPQEYLSDDHGLEYDYSMCVEALLVNVTVEVTSVLNVTGDDPLPSNQTIRVHVSGGRNSSLMQVNDTSTWDINWGFDPEETGNAATWIEFSWSEGWNYPSYENIQISVEITACWNNTWTFGFWEQGCVVPFDNPPFTWNPTPAELGLTLFAFVFLAGLSRCFRPKPEPSKSE